MSDVLQHSAPLEGREGQAALVFVFQPAPGERLVVNTPSLSLSLIIGCYDTSLSASVQHCLCPSYAYCIEVQGPAGNDPDKVLVKQVKC